MKAERTLLALQNCKKCSYTQIPRARASTTTEAAAKPASLPPPPYVFPGTDSTADTPPTFLPEAETPLASGTFSAPCFRKWGCFVLPRHGASCVARPRTLPD